VAAGAAVKLGEESLDGAKVAADAPRRKAMSYERTPRQ
jgi:hypothetical protein